MDLQTLQEMARHQAWADAEYWKVFRGDARLVEDPGIRKRLNHMVTASEMLQMLARGETPDFGQMKDRESAEDLEAAMQKAHEGLAATLASIDLDRIVKLPRGPKGPFEAPAGVLLLQALTHSQHHRGQNAARMRELGVNPPMTDYVVWYALSL
jgi:uncharacterized damage-inducible protein DinB